MDRPNPVRCRAAGKEKTSACRLARLAIAACTLPLLIGANRGPLVVTQKGRSFKPAELTLHAGDTIVIVNDDGELIHHAYVSTDTFSFDSGDQKPGSETQVVFSVKGHFTVLCGIHPKMHLAVDVQ